jgi:hypothetical protein
MPSQQPGERKAPQDDEDPQGKGQRPLGFFVPVVLEVFRAQCISSLETIGAGTKRRRSEIYLIDHPLGDLIQNGQPFLFLYSMLDESGLDASELTGEFE